MTTPRQELLEVLRELSELFPDWRFGQLVANVATAARGPQVESIWDSEDEELLAAARRHNEVVWVKVAGHSGDVLNDRVDRLARAAIASLDRA